AARGGRDRRRTAEHLGVVGHHAPQRRALEDRTGATACRAAPAANVETLELVNSAEPGAPAAAAAALAP
ncbi:MAG: PLP-dependent aminotransferase family protein, partial [Acidobacteriota bacterium]|nr:PLP-dependent aminotransferase family protein [Acidobacteriota bacterium]